MSVPPPTPKSGESSKAETDRRRMPPPPSPPLLPLPPIDVRWVHAGAQHLDLLPNPVTTAATSYKAFSPEESERIEDRWHSLSPAERQRIAAEWGGADGDGAPAKKKAKKDREKRASVSSVNSNRRSPSPARSNGDVPDKEVIRSGEEQKGAVTDDEDEKDGESRYKDIARGYRDREDYEAIQGVPVSQDSLFEVALDTLSLIPVFWAHTGSRVAVVRGSWFVGDETRPCSWDLAEEIEKGYMEIKPWQPSYKHELATAVSLGPAAEEKLKYNLPARFGQGLGVIFEDDEKGRLITTGALTYISRAFWSSLRAKPSGTYVYRGYAAACAASGKTESRSRSASRRGSTASARGEDGAERSSGFFKPKDPIQAAREAGEAAKAGVDGIVEKAREESDRSALEEENVPIVCLQVTLLIQVDASEDAPPCTDLILVIHGIGQQWAAQYEAFNFVYAGNQLRQVLRKQTANPALASIVRDRRCQVLPVQWRASLQLDQERTEEDRQHDMDNRFTMSDITINKSIPYVREVTNSVLLDIPLFMSHHRQKMIEAVCKQANKLYRLWIARNPDFEKNGRVHLIGHSLGSALVAHILSNQPTKMPNLTDLPRQVVTMTKDRFLFNTSSLFLVGSPLGIFLHLDQAQLIARKGRERTMHSPQDEALDRPGKFGCMAIDSLYNVFYFTDPVAYKLNAAVDVRLASDKPPLAITSVTAPFYATVTDGFSSISRYLPTIPGFSTPEKKAARPVAIRLPSGIEMSGPSGEEKLEGTRGERRFSALNPHGNIDFYLPSSGPDYLDMITAHASYWSDASFAAFLLAEVFSTRLDQMRTGMGLAHLQEDTI